MLEPNFVAATMLRNANKFAEAYYRALQPLCLETGLPPLAVDILLFLANNPGRDTARDVATLRGLAKSQVSQAVEHLTDQGILRRCPDREDRRVIHLSITEKGSPLAEEARAIQAGCGRALTAGLTPEEMDCLRHIMEKVMANTERLAGKETLE